MFRKRVLSPGPKESLPESAKLNRARTPRDFVVLGKCLFRIDFRLPGPVSRLQALSQKITRNGAQVTSLRGSPTDVAENDNPNPVSDPRNPPLVPESPWARNADMLDPRHEAIGSVWSPEA